MPELRIIARHYEQSFPGRPYNVRFNFHVKERIIDCILNRCFKTQYQLHVQLIHLLEPNIFVTTSLGEEIVS